MEKSTDYLCERCRNTGRRLKTHHVCGCIYGEKVLAAQKNQEKETRALKLGVSLVLKGIISDTTWKFERERIVEAIQESLDELGI